MELAIGSRMRWYHSIITKVSAIFILAFLGMGAVFYALLEYEKNKDLMQMLEYSRIALHGAFDGKTRSLDFEKLPKWAYSSRRFCFKGKKFSL